MKKDYKEIKNLIKLTKRDMTKLGEQGVDVAELRQQYRSYVAQKADLKRVKNEAKNQLKQMQSQ